MVKVHCDMCGEETGKGSLLGNSVKVKTAIDDETTTTEFKVLVKVDVDPELDAPDLCGNCVYKLFVEAFGKWAR